ncbi:DUF2271 domain-containing protein [bacterium]|nr:MAG: DUF2271 domain-containing protein [bacterium]
MMRRVCAETAGAYERHEASLEVCSHLSQLFSVTNKTKNQDLLMHPNGTVHSITLGISDSLGRNFFMLDKETQSPISRRTLLGRMAALAVSVTALPAMSALAQGSWNRQFELVVDFEINQADGARYRRPYVAVWIEDEAGNAVRTLSLWVQTRKPGPRWIPDLKRWYRKERSRKGRDGGDLIETISVATRKPGQYSLTWNGRNDDGKLVPQGNYSVCIEAAREHGTYQLMRESVSIGSSPFRKSLGSNVEIKGADVSYRKKA